MLNILINDANKCKVVDLKQYFVHEHVDLIKDDKTMYDAVIDCKDNYLTIQETKIDYDDKIKFNINKTLANKLISKRNERLKSVIGEKKDSSYESSFDKLKLIENYYLGYDCVIVTCGPSFNDYKDDVLGLINSRTLLICVKRTYDHLKVCDFYIPGTVSNTVKHPDCNSTIIGVQLQSHHDYIFFDRRRNINVADINFVASGKSRTLYNIPKNIDSMSFKKNALTSKGKMITHLGHTMHGMALPLAIHLGGQKIYL